MSDQPKPTGEHRTKCPSCGQIIPTQKELTEPTGEWTGLSLSRLIKEKGYKGAADAHNAALEAETARCYNDGWVAGLEAADKQLAAERVKYDDLEALYRMVLKDSLNQDEQLADERVKVQMLVDVLNELLETSKDMATQHATEAHLQARKKAVALAKVGAYPLPDGRTQ